MVRSTMLAALLALLGLLVQAVVPVGLAPPALDAAADDYLAQAPTPGTPQQGPGEHPSSEASTRLEAFHRVPPPRSSRDLARANALAANADARRTDLLIAAAAGRTATEQAERQASRNAKLTKAVAEQQANAARLTAEKIAAEQAAQLAKIRAEARRAAGLHLGGAAMTGSLHAIGTDPAVGANTAGPDTAPGPVVTSGAGHAAAPITNGALSAGFGQVELWASYHTGLDYAAAYGTPIHAAGDGTVVVAGNVNDWSGNHVAIRHADGTTTMYSHMSAINARVGEQVQAGDVIGFVGDTGRAFGAHLHFEVYPPAVTPGDIYQAVNPIPWLVAHGIRPA